MSPFNKSLMMIYRNTRMVLDALVEACRIIGTPRIIALHGFHPERFDVPGSVTVLLELSESITV